MIIKVKVKPNAREERFEKISDFEYEIDVREPAEDNKANNKVINILAKELGEDWKKIHVKNPKSRMKIIELK